MKKSGEPFLVIRLSSIGDIVHALPAVAALGRTFPEREIHWVVERRFASLLEGNPYVQRLIQLDTSQWSRRPFAGHTLWAAARAFLQLRDFTYAAAIDFQGLLKSAAVARLTRSRERVGFAEFWAREPMAAAFYTERVFPTRRRHIIELNLALVECVGAEPGPWQFPLPCGGEDDKLVEERLAALRVRAFIIVNPGGGWKSKRWPPLKYSELIRRLQSELPCTFLVTGSPQEEPMIREMLERAGSVPAFYFPSTLVQFIALARRAKLFIGGDTGPLHLAAAVGTPITAIYSAADSRNTPERNGPFHPADITVTNSAEASDEGHRNHSGYLEGVSVEQVLEAVRERWKRAYG